MAYMSQENKATIAPAVKSILKKYKLSGSLSVNNHSTLVLNIKTGAIDFVANYNTVVGAQPGGFRNGSPARLHLDINPYWYKEHFNGAALECLTEIMTTMNRGNHDRSDSMTDYFNVGWYTAVHIGNWKRPYVLVA